MSKTVLTRYQLRTDTHANWSSLNPVLLNQEPIVVIVPADAGAVVQEPAVLFKVGDGTTAYNDLAFSSALAADVYDWAKAATKPSYQASEIGGLADYISGKVQDTNTKYKLEQDTEDTHKIKFYSQELGATEWTLLGTIVTADTVYDDTALAARVTALENGATALEGRVTTAEGKITTLEEKAATLEGQVGTLIGDDTGKSARTIANEELAKQLVPEGAAESLNTLEEIAAWIQAHPYDASAMNAAIVALQNQLKGIDAGEGTVKKYVDDAIIALNVGQYALAADLTALAARVTALETWKSTADTKLGTIAEGATKVEKSDTNGNVKVNGEEVNVYTLPESVVTDDGVLILNGGNAALTGFSET